MTSRLKPRLQAGFTIIEILVAIVVIGITVPAIMIPFSGLEDTKHPEYVIQASFIGQKTLEELSDQFRDTIVTTLCPDGSSAALPPDGDYNLTCGSEQVNADDPDSSTTSTFAVKITLTVSRADGQISPLVFNTLFALNE